MRVRRQIDTLRHYHEIAEVGEIARRYFAMNAFDGVLTTIGVLVGGYLGGIDSARAIFIVVLTTAVGMGVSGFYGSYLVERAERDRAMRELEESTLSSLEDTTIASASRYATIVIALIDGASPFAAALIAMIPFAFTSGHQHPRRLLPRRRGRASSSSSASACSSVRSRATGSGTRASSSCWPASSRS